MIKNILRVVITYVIYVLITIIIFYITGMYAFNQTPTPRFLARMLLLPILLTIITIIITKLTKNLRSEKWKK